MKRLLLLHVALVCCCTVAWTGQADAQVFLNYAVNQPAVLAANAGGDQIICPGDPATLGGNPTGTGGYGTYSYVWFPNSTLNNAAAANPVASPSATTVYFLTMTDSLGCTALDTVEVVVDTCVGIGALAGINAFDVFPNPNEGRFTVAIDLATEPEALSLRMTDVAGREVYAKTLQPARSIREQIRLESLARGTYFIRLDADGIQVSRKLIIR